MALFSCSECRGKVSDKASVCPHCGAPVGGGSRPGSGETPEPQEGHVGPQSNGLNHMRIPHKRPPTRVVTEPEEPTSGPTVESSAIVESVDVPSSTEEVLAQSQEPPSALKGDAEEVPPGKLPQESDQNSEMGPESDDSVPLPTPEDEDWNEDEPGQGRTLLVSVAVIAAVLGGALAFVWTPGSTEKQATWDDVAAEVVPARRAKKAKATPVKKSKTPSSSTLTRDANYRNSAVWRENLRSSFEPLYSKVTGTYLDEEEPCLNLRVEPDNESEKKACIIDGTELFIQGKNMQWFAVTVESGRYQGLSGFVHSKWVK
jgi:hypothetical protein